MRRKKTLEPQLSSCDLKSAAISLPSASDATEAGSTFRGFPLSSARGPRMGQEQGPGGKRRSERKERLRGKEDRVGARYTPQVRGFPPAPLAPAISFGTSDNSGAREQVAPPRCTPATYAACGRSAWAPSLHGGFQTFWTSRWVDFCARSVLFDWVCERVWTRHAQRHCLSTSVCGSRVCLGPRSP